MFTTRHALAALFACGLIAGMSSRVDAAATIRCFDAATVLSGLKEKEGEVPVFTGVGIGGEALTITVSPTTGSWSMLQVLGGTLCMIAAGDMIKAPDAPAKPSSLPDAPALLRNGLLLIKQ